MNDKRAKVAGRTGWQPTAFAKVATRMREKHQTFDLATARSSLRSDPRNINIYEKPQTAPMPSQVRGQHGPKTLSQLNDREFYRSRTADRVASPIVQMMKGATDQQRRLMLKKARAGLKKPQVDAPQLSSQRYIMSPLEHTKNLFDNAFGMALHSQDIGTNIVQPVFMHHLQRQSFAKRVKDKRESYGSGMVEIGPMNKTETAMGYYEKREALNALREASSLTGSKMSLQGVRNAVVYTQGHGSPGKRHISSDSEYMTEEQAKKWQQENPRVKYQKVTNSKHPQFGKFRAFETATDKQTASSLHGMDISDTLQLRANSCHSGTEKRLIGHDFAQITSLFFKNQLTKFTGKWKNTFAGGLQSQLNKQIRGKASGVEHSSLKRPGPFSVTGYIGPTTQGAMKTLKRNKSIAKHFAVVLPYTHSGSGNKLAKQQSVPMRRSESSRRVLSKD